MELYRTLQRLPVSVVKTMGAPVRMGCIATHPIQHVKQYPTQPGCRPAIRQTIPKRLLKLVCVEPPCVNPRSMVLIVSPLQAVAVVTLAHLESTVPIVVQLVVRVLLLLLLV